MIWFWLGFLALVTTFLALDLGVFHRKAHAVSIKEALIWSVVWVTTSLLFSGFIFLAYSNHWLGLGSPNPNSSVPDVAKGLSGTEAFIKYITGYVIEWSLSVDNIFVIALIFGYFRIPAKYQHRVLFWGIMGAIVMRGVFIALGAQLIANFHWIIPVFGLFLVYTAFKMLMSDDEADPSKSWALKQLYKRFPVTDTLHGTRFFVYEGEIAAGEAKAAENKSDVPAPREAATRDVGKPEHVDKANLGRRVLTPLAVALVIVEVTDLIFAVDSIPAIFGITTDPFLVFTSNIFAILGLRSMYFALAGLLHKFHLLKTALALILGFVGVKMLLGAHRIEHWLNISHNTYSVLTLAIILTLLAGGVIASLMFPKAAPTEGEHLAAEATDEEKRADATETGHG
ncbi:MAG: TerC family protein [Proteobacteria bacterium]|nr:MAG: TerC family protein [Pseudomonadota bacterium]